MNRAEYEKKIGMMDDAQLLVEWEKFMDGDNPDYEMESTLEDEISRRVKHVDTGDAQIFARQAIAYQDGCKLKAQEQQIESLTKSLIESIEELHPLTFTDHRDIVNRAMGAMGYTLDEMRLYLRGEVLL